MQSRLGANCSVMLAFGLLACCFLAIYWPHEPTVATTSPSQTNVQLVTVAAHSIIPTVPDNYAVFALDCVSGQLQGAIISGRAAGFTEFYYRDVAVDFGVDPTQADVRYQIVSRPPILGFSSRTLMLAKNRLIMNSELLYVGESNSGMVHAYAFHWKEARGKQPPVQLKLIDVFPFRQPMQK